MSRENVLDPRMRYASATQTVVSGPRFGHLAAD